MESTEFVDENLIVCAGGVDKGPCKVYIIKIVQDWLNVLPRVTVVGH